MSRPFPRVYISVIRLPAPVTAAAVMIFVWLLIPFVLSSTEILPEGLLEKVDALASYPDTDFSAQYTVIHDKPDKGRSVTVSQVFRRDDAEKYVILALEPASRRGQGYLRTGSTLWVYDPESRRFNSTSSQNRFQNSNARNSDFTQSTLSIDYSIISAERALLGRFQCWRLQLESVDARGATPSMAVWIDDENLLRKAEDYSHSGKLMRTTAIPEYHRINGRKVPRTVLIEDALAGAVVDGFFIRERTLITVSDISFEDLPDSVFSKTYLERAGQ